MPGQYLWVYTTGPLFSDNAWVEILLEHNIAFTTQQDQKDERSPKFRAFEFLYSVVYTKKVKIQLHFNPAIWLGWFVQAKGSTSSSIIGNQY